MYHLSLGREGDGSGNDWDWSCNEWGYRLEKLNDGTMGHPKDPFLPDWKSFEKLCLPKLREEERTASLPQFLAKLWGKKQTDNWGGRLSPSNPDFLSFYFPQAPE